MFWLLAWTYPLLSVQALLFGLCSGIMSGGFMGSCRVLENEFPCDGSAFVLHHHSDHYKHMFTELSCNYLLILMLLIYTTSTSRVSIALRAQGLYDFSTSLSQFGIQSYAGRISGFIFTCFCLFPYFVYTQQMSEIIWYKFPFFRLNSYHMTLCS